MSGPASPVVQDRSGFVIELEQFSGPLDLLLHLIHEDELDITDLPIAKIADQFLAVINELGLNQAADYLEMAARLLRIKAQMLLPRRLETTSGKIRAPSWCGGCSSTNRSASWWSGWGRRRRAGRSSSGVGSRPSRRRRLPRRW